jgi:hypothetical protein
MSARIRDERDITHPTNASRDCRGPAHLKPCVRLIDWRKNKMKIKSTLSLTFCALFLSSSGVGATEPSSVRATGVDSEEFGIDRSNWDQPASPIISFTQTEKIFPTTIMKQGKESTAAEDITTAAGYWQYISQ